MGHNRRCPGFAMEFLDSYSVNNIIQMGVFVVFRTDIADDFNSEIFTISAIEAIDNDR
jgi:hypothetical protein